MPAPALWTAEWIAAGFFVYLIAVSRLQGLDPRARRRVLLVGLVCVGLVVLLAGLRPSPPLRVVREWVPGIYLLEGYWLCGLFFRQPMRELERRLLGIDRWLLDRAGLGALVARAPRPIVAYFELMYLTAYPFVPASFGLLLALGGRERADAFWTAVLMASLGCYGMLPWIQTRPPRALPVGPGAGAPVTTPLRRINVALLRRVSVQVNTFPSGHAATTVAAALAVASVAPAVGAGLGVAAASIVVATVLGRYHYAVDSVLGAVVGVAAWWVAFS